ncbi:uncharacterized protein LOC129586549 [Paramacrobiotus metropolitanus]|uniref:uncharacterized protein LOC129586549 n=1 Tax=Paramacrobiotus metropolitanus TaxID=2943436 RepID=UPI0024459BBC|nr:uncharacterized protein LOC129586549 [Paramacrobiotus metropolitanus]
MLCGLSCSVPRCRLIWPTTNASCPTPSWKPSSARTARFSCATAPPPSPHGRPPGPTPRRRGHGIVRRGPAAAAGVDGTQDLVYPLQHALDEEHQRGEVDDRRETQQQNERDANSRGKSPVCVFGVGGDDVADMPAPAAPRTPDEAAPPLPKIKKEINPYTAADGGPLVVDHNDSFIQYLNHRAHNPPGTAQCFPPDPRVERIHAYAMDLLNSSSSTEAPLQQPVAGPSHADRSFSPLNPSFMLRSVGLATEASLEKLGKIHRMLNQSGGIIPSEPEAQLAAVEKTERERMAVEEERERSRLAEQEERRQMEERDKALFKTMSKEELLSWLRFQDYTVNRRERDQCSDYHQRVVAAIVYFLSTMQPTSVVDYDPFKLPVASEATAYASLIKRPRCLDDILTMIQGWNFDYDEVINQLLLIPLNAVIYNKPTDLITSEAIRMFAFIESVLKNTDAFDPGAETPTNVSLEVDTIYPDDTDDNECFILDAGKTPRKRKRASPDSAPSTPAQDTSAVARHKRERQLRNVFSAV